MDRKEMLKTFEDQPLTASEEEFWKKIYQTALASRQYAGPGATDCADKAVVRLRYRKKPQNNPYRE